MKEKRSCKDCFNLVAKIPVKVGKLLYVKATARCKEGYLKRGDSEDDYIVKNVLKGSVTKDLKLYGIAKRCPGFDIE